MFELRAKMESFSSRSSMGSNHNLVRAFPSAEEATMLEASSCGRLTMHKKGSGTIKVEERDDAYGSNKMSEGERWHFERKGNLPIQEITPPLPQSSERRGMYLVEARQSERHRHYPSSSNWYTSRRHSRPSPRVAYRMNKDTPRRAVGMVPVSHDDDVPPVSPPRHHPGLSTRNLGVEIHRRGNPQTWLSGHETSSYLGYDSAYLSRVNSSRGGRQHLVGQHTSRVIIPSNLVIPRAISSPSVDSASTGRPTEGSGKRPRDSLGETPSPPSVAKKVKARPAPPTPTPAEQKAGTFDMLDLLCSATLELGPLQENPTGCSCPKSKCIALYCDCFKAGRRCDPKTCTCLDCKNTIEESGINGARSKAIQSILARNPRAFTNAGGSKESIPAGTQACNCIRSQCLKLYCTCFQVGKSCNPAVCSCVGCLNTEDDTTGRRKAAIEMTLEKRPDAFKAKAKKKEIGSGCACKNNRCVRKYCECFRTGLSCTRRCSCKDCQNQEESDDNV